MALRNILVRGEPTLNKISREVTDFNDRIHQLLDDMRDTLKKAEGVGLAAPQVGVLRRVVLVLDTNIEDDDFDAQVIEMINPVILETEGEQTDAEGCLSVPGVYGMVTRPMRVKVAAYDRNGNRFERWGEGLTARAFCHEIDHLDGHLFVELTDDLFAPEQLDRDDSDNIEYIELGE